jgi:hypothetical protein
MTRYVYTAQGALHPDREGALQKTLLTSDAVTARRLNTAWADAQVATRKIGWQGHARTGPFVVTQGLIWDDGEKIWAVCENPWSSLESGYTAWKMLSRTEVNS